MESSGTHTYRQYMAILGTHSESTTIFDIVFRRASHSLNHCVQLTSP